MDNRSIFFLSFFLCQTEKKKKPSHKQGGRREGGGGREEEVVGIDKERRAVTPHPRIPRRNTFQFTKCLTFTYA